MRHSCSFALELTRAAGLAHVHFTNSGAEANEAALKLARKWGRLHRGGAHQIITTLGEFPRSHAGVDGGERQAGLGLRCFRPSCPAS